MELEDLTFGQMSLHGKDQGETGKMKTPCRTYREENVFQALREQLCLAIHGRRKTFFGISQVFPKDLSMEKVSKIETVIFKRQLLFTNRTQTKQYLGPEDKAEVFLQLGVDYGLSN